MKRRLKVHKEGYAILFSLLTLLVVANVIVFIESPNRILSVVCLIISILKNQTIDFIQFSHPRGCIMGKKFFQNEKRLCSEHIPH